MSIKGLRIKDSILLVLMMVLAGACIIYEYLLSHYAGRVLGLMEHAIFITISLMVVSMGFGSLVAKYIKDADNSFLRLEFIIACFASVMILSIAFLFALSHNLPKYLSATLSMDYIPSSAGGFLRIIQKTLELSPYIFAVILGVFIGMEIPLIARIRQSMYQEFLEHNVGIVYGLDYIGGGFGALIFITVLIYLPAEQASFLVALCNLMVGLVFIILRYNYIRRPKMWILLHLVLLVMVGLGVKYAGSAHAHFENMLYKDTVVYSYESQFQHITITQSPNDSYNLYLNGRTQFSSSDEKIYHNMLTYPVLMSTPSLDNILIIGGGDGLALRDVFDFNPGSVTMVELDQTMIDLFSGQQPDAPPYISESLLRLNERSLLDSRLKLVYGDAFNAVDDLYAQGVSYDAIIVDLPDPSHPDLNKLYSVSFYHKLNRILHKDGALVIQSTSPYHAKQAFLTVGVTLKQSGFDFVERYHVNVPSFGQWGFTIATKNNRGAKDRIIAYEEPLPTHGWASKDLILGSFQFGNGYFDEEQYLQPNYIDNLQMYNLHYNAWKTETVTID